MAVRRIVCCFLLCWSLLVMKQGTQACGGGGEAPCSSTQSSNEDSGQILPTNVRDYSYRRFEQVSGVRAVDVALVVSVVRDSLNYHRWLQIAVHYLESHLRALGVGVEAGWLNRYALLQFGARVGHLSARFIRIDNNVFFPAESFNEARRQLRLIGVTADGYQAIDFSLKQVPFRNDSSVGKLVIFVANSERDAPIAYAHITMETVEALLQNSSIRFNAVLRADISMLPPEENEEEEIVAGATTPTTHHHVLGLSSHVRGFVPGINYTYDSISGKAVLISLKRNLLRDYANLTLNNGGLLWSLNSLLRENVTVIKSFVGTMVDQQGLHGIRRKEVCERCRCGEGAGQGEGCGGGSSECDVPEDQSLCKCLVDSSPSKCGIVIQPSPVSPTTATAATTATTKVPRQTPILIEVSGNVSKRPGGDVTINFRSNKNKAVYDCVHLDNSTLTPTVTRCTSPQVLKSVQEGRHTFLVIAKRKGFYGARRFDFEVASDNPPLPTQLELQLNQLIRMGVQDINVEIRVTVIRDGHRSSPRDGEISLLCSVETGRLTPCTSPYPVPLQAIGHEGLSLAVVAMDNRGNAVLATTHVKQPYRPGPVRITVRRVDPPDAFGRVKIHFTTSRPDVYCACRTNITRTSCSGSFVADPQVMGAGTHHLTIVCMDPRNYQDTNILKIILPAPPPLIQDPLRCNLSLVGPTPQGVVLAVFGCDRPVLATCQVSGRPAVSCDAVSGIHEIDTRELDSGPHLFILNVRDVHDKTLMKLHHFSIGTAHRRCCPQINRSLSTYTSTSRAGQPYLLLDLRVAAGNCTESEGFSYNIDWGDGSSEMGLAHRLGPVAVSRSFNSTSPTPPQPLGPQVQVSYCNNPILQANKCCDTATFQPSL